MVADTLGPQVSVFSYLRSRSELWVAMQFSALTQYHGVFRSCNRAFHQDRTARLTRWCGTCDKCCFIDLILAPFMAAAELRRVFDGHEPLDDADLEDRFFDLLGLDPEAKPFECVGDVEECRAALFDAALRPDRQDSPVLHGLAEYMRNEPGLRYSDSNTLSSARGDCSHQKLADVWGTLQSFALGSTATAQAFVLGERSSTMPVLRGGQTAAFVWGFTAGMYPRLISWVRFTDDVGLHWEIDVSLHLEKLAKRDW